jgi:hypothetical protein
VLLGNRPSGQISCRGEFRLELQKSCTFRHRLAKDFLGRGR